MKRKSRAASRDRYVALLRGINVGGKNVIPMTKLESAFEGMGFEDVSTYIQSGNVLFSGAGVAKRLARQIEVGLKSRFKYDARVVVVSERELAAIVERAPNQFTVPSKVYRCDVIFLRAPLISTVAVKAFDPKEGVDQIWPGKGVVYFSRLNAKLGRSRMSRITRSQLYQDMTIRNWNTTTNLLARLREANPSTKKAP